MSGQDFNIDDFLPEEGLYEQVNRATIKEYINTAITQYFFDDEEKERVCARAEKISELYSARDIKCLDILRIAAKKGCFDDISQRLEELYTDRKLYLGTTLNAKPETKSGAIAIMDAVLDELLAELKNEEETN